MMKEEYHRTQRLLSEKREELKSSSEKRNERLHYGEGYEKSSDQRYVQGSQQSGQKPQEQLNRSTGNISARQSAKNLSYSYMNDQADKMKSGAVDLALSLAQHPQSRKGIYSK
jgi:hypothetical protein